MIDFNRKKDELPPLLHNIGDKIMGYHVSIGGQMLVGGEIVERKQSTSYLDENEYNIKLEPELCEGSKEGKDSTWWLNEKEAKPFKQTVWDRVVIHWLEHCRFQRKGYLEYIRMHKALREEPDDMSDRVLEKELDERHSIKKTDNGDTKKVSDISIVASHVSETDKPPVDAEKSEKKSHFLKLPIEAATVEDKKEE